MKTEHWIEELKFSVELFDAGGNLIEVLARLHDLDAARATYTACREKYPTKLLYLCQGGRILRRSEGETEGRRHHRPSAPHQPGVARHHHHSVDVRLAAY